MPGNVGRNLEVDMDEEQYLGIAWKRECSWIGEEFHMNTIKGRRLESDPLFLVEYMKATITSDILSVMEKESITVSELAGRLGKSRQYVSRVLNETANFTLNSVARVAAALEKDVVLRLVDYEDEVVIRPFVKQELCEGGQGCSCSDDDGEEGSD